MPTARSSAAASRVRRASPRTSPGSRKARRSGAVRLPHARVRWDRVGRVALLVVLAVVALLYIQQGVAYLSVRHQYGGQRALVSTLAHQNAQLLSQQRSLQDPATILLEARKLGMVRPTERPYSITGSPGQ